MTGLKPDGDRIIEMALSSPASHRRQAPMGSASERRVLSGMTHEPGTHGRSGLIDKVKASTVTRPPSAPRSRSCASTCRRKHRRCAQLDLPGPALLRAPCPFRRLLSLPNLDVSTLKELARRWKPELMKACPGGQARGVSRRLRIDRRAQVLPRISLALGCSIQAGAIAARHRAARRPLACPPLGLQI
jgi:oligoribonuclease